MRAIVFTASFVLLLEPPSTVRAGNDDAYPHGNEGAITAGAVAATASDASAVWYNPAGLGGIERSRLELSGTAFSYQSRRIPGGMFTILPDGRTLRNDLDGSRFAIVAPALSLTRKLGEGLGVGFGVFISEQEELVLGGGITDRDVEGRGTFQRTDISLSGVRYHAGPSVGWQPHPRVRVGASVFGVYQTLEARARFALGLEDPSTTPESRATLLVDVTDQPIRLGMEAVVGVQLEPVDGFHVGLVLRSPRVLLHDEPDARVLSTSAFTSPDQEALVTLDFGEDEAPPADVGLSSPARAVLGLAWSLPGGGRVSVEADFSHGLMREALDVDRSPVWNARAGALFPIGDGLELGGGLFTDRSFANRPDGLVFDVDYVGATLGLRNATKVELGEGEDADTLIFASTFAARYAVGLGQVTPIGFDLPDSSGTGEIFVTAAPTDVTFHEVSLYVGSSLSF